MMYLELGESRRETWNVLRTLMKKFLVESWQEMLNICVAEETQESDYKMSRTDFSQSFEFRIAH
jgi:hypothetical protein